MNSIIQTFEYNDQSIRQTVSEDGEILFCAKDIAEALGYKDADRITRVLDDEDEPRLLGFTDSSGREQKMLFVNECQLYGILMTLRTKRTKPFRRWVAQEVLPSIRKNGFYLSPYIIDNLTQNNSLPVVKALAEAVVHSQEDVKDMQEQLDIFQESNDTLKLLAERGKKVVDNQKKWQESPDRKYDVSFKYSDGRRSNRRDLPTDIAVGFNKIEGEKYRGLIIETGERLLYEYYRREIKKYLLNENQLKLKLKE